MYDKDNLFAKMLRGEIPQNKKIYDDEYAMAFHDISPIAETHVLVLPRGEYKNMMDFTLNAPPEFQAGYWRAVQNTIDILGLTAYMMIANTNTPYQSVFHFHLHIVSGKWDSARVLPFLPGLSCKPMSE
ncbi:MAG: HIT domain-containing protein [Rickettsiales bacterium]|jgi:diadenosine tetraphosphate (Ap4A) HIT family hydrolase|nr:HIT domain-containing protein [Rickettsiales bacterium]